MDELEHQNPMEEDEQTSDGGNTFLKRKITHIRIDGTISNDGIVSSKEESIIEDERGNPLVQEMVRRKLCPICRNPVESYKDLRFCGASHFGCLRCVISFCSCCGKDYCYDHISDKPYKDEFFCKDCMRKTRLQRLLNMNIEKKINVEKKMKPLISREGK